MIFISDIRQYLFISRLKILESANCVQFGGRNVARNVIGSFQANGIVYDLIFLKK